ncbi:CpaE family protein [Microbacterium sp. ZW T5_45]|uniref:AAA family ATPase n=1 Tax=Microbacterium sp. ZW T5_45 TaxID=3378080 RepID=UPI0038525A54
MTSVVLAIPEPHAARLAAELALEDVHISAVVAPNDVLPLPAGTDAVIITATRRILTPALLAACDRAGTRVIPFGTSDERLLAKYGLPAAIPSEAAGWEVVAALALDSPSPVARAQSAPSRIIAVWGASGSPGRSTVAIQLAVELARSGRQTALVDADTVAPSLALLLGLEDDAPGVASACRRAELGALDREELSRLATAVSTSAGDVDVLGGINRPSRWPEISESRLRSTLVSCRSWAEDTIVDVAAPFDADEEATYDMVGPRRHGATTGAIAEADAVIAITAADPLGISRFLREYAELRGLAGETPITVVANQIRPGPLGIDAKGQVGRTLARFAGIDDVTFLPYDQRATDAALLHARPIGDVAPRSPLVAAIRRLAATLSADATAGNSTGSSRASRRLRPARAARGA